MILRRINIAVLAVIWLCGIAAGQCVQSQSEVVTLYFGVETPPPDAHFQTIPSAHTDIETPFHFIGGWDVHIKTDLPARDTRIETEDAFFAVTADSHFIFEDSVPSAYAFIGAAANEIFWLYGGYEVSPGFHSQDMDLEVSALCQWNPNKPAKGANSNQKWLQVRLVAVRGPAGGQVAMFDDDVTPIMFFATSDGIDNNDAYYIVVKNHSHKSWTFTKPGLYEVDLQIATYYQCDASLTEDRNGDCVVDLEDFAALAAEEWILNDLLTFVGQWLDCGSPFDSECP